MMRLPRFRYRAPTRLDEAIRILAGEGQGAMLLAGGTDLLPNMKRRQQTPDTLVALRSVEELRRTATDDDLSLGAGLTLSELLRLPQLRREHAALWLAAAQVATPHLRNMATLGGNLCLDTRCTYYDQSYEWRKAISFCMKRDGETCWVAPGSPRCLAVSSTDTAPALTALGARAVLTSLAGTREIPLAELYRNDGMDYLTRRPDEILSEVRIPRSPARRSTYWKLRRRGSFDFPVLGVAAAVELASDGTVREARVVLGAVASRPVPADEAGAFLVGRTLEDEAIDEAARLAAKPAKPMDNADFTLHWRKRQVSAFVGYALRELRGDDMREVRIRTARWDVPNLRTATST